MFNQKNEKVYTLKYIIEISSKKITDNVNLTYIICISRIE